MFWRGELSLPETERMLRNRKICSLLLGLVWSAPASVLLAQQLPPGRLDANADLFLGRVASWGNGALNPIPGALSNVTAIATVGCCGGGAALDGEGKLMTWGILEELAGMSNLVAISGAWSSFVALKSNGTVGAWEPNGDFQTNLPPRLSNVVAVAAGDLQSLALKADGSVVSWYRNDPGSSLADTNSPLKDVVAIAAGPGILALRPDGTITGAADIPPGLSNIVAIASGWATIWRSMRMAR